MKKILPAIFLLLLFCLNLGSFCLAGETNSSDNIFTDNSDENNLELRGYLEYEDEPQETIFLEDQGETPQNTIYMKTPSKQRSVNIEGPKKIGSKSLLSTAAKQVPEPAVNRLEAASKFSSQEYDINPVSSSYSGKSGNMTFGTTYDSSISSAQLNYSAGFFTRYDGKRFAITSAFSKNTDNNYDGYDNKLYLAPELKLTKRLSLLDVMQSDLVQPTRKNEVVLRYRPKIGTHSDDIQFELGAAQSYNENQYINSSVRFSTRFKL